MGHWKGSVNVLKVSPKSICNQKKGMLLKYKDLVSHSLWPQEVFDHDKMYKWCASQINLMLIKDWQTVISWSGRREKVCLSVFSKESSFPSHLLLLFKPDIGFNQKENKIKRRASGFLGNLFSDRIKALLSIMKRSSIFQNMFSPRK